MSRRLGLLVLLALLAACNSKPRAGEWCNLSELDCVDEQTAIACDNGTYREVPCRGPRGCTDETEINGPEPITGIAACDINPQQGDACSPDYHHEPLCNSAVGTSLFVCDGGVWQATDCPSGCEQADGGPGACK